MMIYLLRHTAVSFPADRCYGQTEVPLSGSFDMECELIQQKIRDLSFQHIYSSPLLRCKVLTDRIAGNVPFSFDERLKEINFGDWEDQPWSAIESTEAAQKWFSDWFHQPTPNGESFEDLLSRVNDFYQDIKSNGENVLVVTHGGVIRALNAIQHQLDPMKAFELKVDFGDLLCLESKNE